MVTSRLIGMCLVVAVVFGPVRSARCQWISTNNPENVKVHCLAASESSLFLGTGSGVYRSTNNGDVWTHVDGIPDLGVSAIVAHGSIVLAAVYDSLCIPQLYRSVDNGTSWTQLSPDTRLPYFSTLVANGSFFFSTSICGIYRSADSGVTWMPISTGIMEPAHFKVDALAIHDSNLFIKPVVGECSFGAPLRVFRSTNNGTIWTVAGDGLDRDGIRITALASIGQAVFAGGGSNGGDSVYQWTKSTAQWTPVGSISAGHYIQSLVTSGTKMFAGVQHPLEDRIFFSSDSGRNWISVSEGLEEATIYTNPFEFVVSNEYLFAGIVDKGVWRRPLSEMIGKSEVKRASANNHLIGFPNPLSTSTQITFTTKTEGEAEITIIDLLGVEVTHLFSGPLQAGKHSFTWNATLDVPDGVYECIAKINGKVERTSLVLMR